MSAAYDSQGADLASAYRAVRAATERLAEPLSPEDCTVQSMEDASPTKWHLAHTSWYFETFVLESAVPGYRHFDPDFRVLFNSYYNGVGAQYARPRRGLLSRPDLERVFAYRRHVDRQMTELLDRGSDLDDEVRAVIEIGIHHEQQHQELILTDLKHMLSLNPTHPAYRELATPAPGRSVPTRWIAHAAGLRELGHDGSGFSFDNERPRHPIFLAGFQLASRPVTNREYAAFLESGGYEDPAHWLADGWAAVQERGWQAPLYWERHEDGWKGWKVQTLAGLRDLNPDEPVCHVSYYEADAFARASGARLATEAEWEIAARDVPVAGNLVESDHLHPTPADAGADEAPLQIYGDVWEWTQSPYVPYPGFRAPCGALGEYNGKFMSNQLVLRGGSCVTPASHIRSSYRNFFHPDARWQFSGIRLARDA